MRTLRRVIVCADDFARDEPTSSAILKLLSARRLSAVSCFTDSPVWPEHGPRLLEHAADAYLGLHFNLTERFGRGERPLAYWIARALSGAVDREAVRAHLERQVDAFIRVVGRAPDYVDGHRHVHAFPGISDVLKTFVIALRQDHPVQIRALTPPFGRTDAPLKRRVIQTLARLGGGTAGGLAFNRAFGGDYSLRPDVDYGALFWRWLAAAPEGALIMCHPTAGRGGPLSAGEREARFLASRRYERLLRAGGLELARPPDRSRGVLWQF